MHFYTEVRRYMSIPKGAMVDCDFPKGTFLWQTTEDGSDVYTFVENKKLFDSLTGASESLLSKRHSFHQTIDKNAAIIKVKVEGEKITEICSIYLPPKCDKEISISAKVLSGSLNKINELYSISENKSESKLEMQ